MKKDKLHKFRKIVLQYSLALFLTLFGGGLLVILQGEKPIYALKEIFYVAFANPISLANL